MTEPTPAPANANPEFGDELGVLPIRNAVLFPGAVAPFDVGRQKSIALVEAVRDTENPVIAIFAQRDPSTDDPGSDDLYPMGCAAKVLKALKHDSGNYSLILQGLSRIRLEALIQTDPYLRMRISRVETPTTEDVEIDGLAMKLRNLARQVIALMPELPSGAGELVNSIKEPGALADLIAANLDVPVDRKIKLLESVVVKERLQLDIEILEKQLQVLTAAGPMSKCSVEGWAIFGTHGSAYAAELTQEVFEGKPVVRMWRSSDGDSGFGSMHQTFAADAYRGKRVRFSAALRSKDVSDRASLCIRVDGDSRRSLGFDNMFDRPPITGTTEWARHACVVDVAMQASSIYISNILSGRGELCWADIHFEVVDDSVVVTDMQKAQAVHDAPTNLDFSGSR